MNKRKRLLLGVACLLMGTTLAILQFKTQPAVKIGSGNYEAELPIGQFFTVFDDQKQILDKLNRYVFAGDEIITGDFKHYRIEKLQGRTAVARYLGREKVDLAESVATITGNQATGVGKKSQIAIYHTHSDESYVPTDGAPNIPAKGGIFKVGKIFKTTLVNRRLDAIQSLQPHDPHDANAYMRSRRTAMQLLKTRPAALIDVHRDAIPDPDFYSKKVGNETITRMRLVVGRQNPNMQANMDFAKKVMAQTNRDHPGLVKEIFIGRGNYNQDLSPHAMLVEVGTHTNSRTAAEKGVAVFADSLPKILGISAQGGTAPRLGVTNRAVGTRAQWSSAAFLAIIFIVAAGIFLLVSTGSVGGSVGKIKQFFTSEWANALGLIRRRRKQK